MSAVTSIRGQDMNNPSMTTRWALAPLLAALVVAGCATTPAFEPVAAPAAPAAFKELDGRWAALEPAEAQARGEWWKAFADPLLDDLIARADQHNTSIQLSGARLAQARALLRSADADRLPQIGLGAGGGARHGEPGVGHHGAGHRAQCRARRLVRAGFVRPPGEGQ
jgi:multidrug efflux system outer membrane protein